MLLFLETLETPEEKALAIDLYERYRNLVYYIAFQKLGNIQEAEDVVQDTFVSILSSLNAITDPIAPQTKAFIITIAEYRTIDQLRKRKSGRLQPLIESVQQPMMLEADIIEQNTITSTIAKLSPELQRLLLLRYDTGLTVSEIASLTGVSESSIYKKIARAKELLLKQLIKEGVYDEE